MDLSLGGLKLYKTLEKRKGCQTAKMFVGLLLPIASYASGLLELIKKTFPEYTDHGIQHSFRILEYVSSVLTDKMIKDMSSAEIGCLIMGALFHDTGMSNYTVKESKEELREKHHEYSVEIFSEFCDKRLEILSEKDRYKSVISFICRAHGLSIEQLYADSEFDKKDTIGFNKIRYSLLAILLRIGDLMDLDISRVNLFVLSLFRSTYNAESLQHNIRHTKIESHNYSNKELSVEVSVNDRAQYKIWNSWLDWLRNEIIRANSYLYSEGFYIPELKDKIKKPDTLDIQTEDLRFEIDTKSKILTIFSESIYTDEFDFIRELIQNAIDASLFTWYTDTSIEFKDPSPRSWRANKPLPPIKIMFSQERSELSVVDFGIGMNYDDLKKFLFTVSETGYTKQVHRDFAFPSIANFGIGFVSCLINANQIDIFTKKKSESLAELVSLTTNVNNAVIEKVKNVDFSGTIIRLKLKHKFEYSNILSYISNTFKFPSVGIDIINIDALANISKELNCNFDYNKLIESPQDFFSDYNNLKDKIEKFIKPLKKQYDETEYLNKKIDYILKSLRDKKDYLSKDYVNSIEEIKKLAAKSQSKDIFDADFDAIKDFGYLYDVLRTALIVTQDILDKLFSESSQYESCIKEIPVRAVNEYNWKYCIAELDNHLDICRVEFTDKINDLSKKSGFLFINQDKNLYNIGIEYSAVNMFLLKKGRICKEIYKVSSSLIDSIREQTDDFDNSELFDEDDIEYFKEHIFENTRGYSNNHNYSDEDSYDYSDNNLYDYSGNDSDEDDEDDFQIKKLSIYDNEVIYSLENVKNRMNYLEQEPYLEEETKIFQDFGYNKDCFEDVKKLDDVFFKSSIFCQDGIEIPFSIFQLLPLGKSIIRCNLTANARMPLNVTRHGLSKNRDVINSWLKNTGKIIQENVVKYIKDILKSLKIEYKNDDLISTLSSSDYFVTESNKQLVSYLKQTSNSD